LELASYQHSAHLRQQIGMFIDHPGQVRPISTGLILSTHDFEARPTDLYQQIEAMLAAPACRVVKIAWQARSLRDNVQAFEIIAQRHKPTIALCMGEAGLLSRVLAQKFGALITYAALGDGAGTAPGQPTVKQLKKVYRWDQIRASTRVFGIIGWPTGHSMSPAIHNAGFDAANFDGVYLPLPIQPDYVHFKATVGELLAMPELHFGGASVTIPHKENLVRFVVEHGGEVEPLAQQIGAANTLLVRADGSLYAANTDYAGALDSVCAALGIEREELHGLKVAVIGAGGAARAVVAGFVHYGAHVLVYNRTYERAAALAEQFAVSSSALDRQGKVTAAQLDALPQTPCQLVINCTPLGMSPDTDATPMPASDADSFGWGPGMVVVDTIYNPPVTRLLRQARAAGCVTIGGGEMFVRQAAAQFRLWTGKDAPIDLFRRTLAEQLE
jgi:3-dehydroquinate dehydratase/shikimate dehydrogenase